MEKIARIAAEWMLEQLKQPEFDNDDISLASELAEGLVEPITEEMGKKYIEVLSEKIIEELKKNNRCELFIDYDPDKILTDAAVAAGIDIYDYPWKTRVSIKYRIVDGKETSSVTVVLGSRGKAETIYEVK